MDVGSREARESLVVWPNSGREQLKKMAVGISKIDACASIRPGEAALDDNARLLEPLGPRRQTRRGNAESLGAPDRSCRVPEWFQRARPFLRDRCHEGRAAGLGDCQHRRHRTARRISSAEIQIGPSRISGIGSGLQRQGRIPLSCSGGLALVAPLNSSSGSCSFPTLLSVSPRINRARRQKGIIDLLEPIGAGGALSFVSQEEDACCDQENPYPFSSPGSFA